MYYIDCKGGHRRHRKSPLHLISDIYIPGALDGGSPMSHVDFKKWQSRISLSFIFRNVTCQFLEKDMSHVTIHSSPCRMLLSLMSHVEFKKCPCRPVDFRGLVPYIYLLEGAGRRSRGDRNICFPATRTLTLRPRILLPRDSIECL